LKFFLYSKARGWGFFVEKKGFFDLLLFGWDGMWWDGDVMDGDGMGWDGMVT